MSVLRVPTFTSPLVFVDIETNGLNHVRGRVIEVAAIRVENGQITRTFNSLIDPETELPQFITRLTGIQAGELAGAPTFDQIADELSEVLQDAIFVAHNVRFDYSFLKQEFARLGMKFLPKQLCTVKLSRSLYPHEKGHKLEDLIRRHAFTFAQRHRAHDDAAILWQFVQYIVKHHTPEQIEAAIARQIRQPAIPKGVPTELVKNLPETTGVYIFEDEAGRPLYVGKSVNIKHRVMSHFGRDHAESKEFKISQTIRHIRTEETPTELAALLLESQLVKELQPLHNRKLRRAQRLTLLKEQRDDLGYTHVVMEEAAEIDPENIGSVLAVYTTRGKARQSIQEAIRTYDLCPKLMGLEKSKAACFSHQLKKCRGACVSRESALQYNNRLMVAFERQRLKSWPYKGPVLLEETTARTAHALLVDQWCVLGEVQQEEYCEPVLKSKAKHFDLDTYKILQSFMATQTGKFVVKPLGSQQLQMMLG
jgi:DNA polymerase III subunit epsilon